MKVFFCVYKAEWVIFKAIFLSMENLFEKIKSIVEASVFFYILGRILFGNTFFIFFIISIFFFIFRAIKSEHFIHQKFTPSRIVVKL